MWCYQTGNSLFRSLVFFLQVLHVFGIQCAHDISSESFQFVQVINCSTFVHIVVQAEQLHVRNEEN